MVIYSVLSELSARINSACASFSNTSRSKGKVTLNSLPVPGWLLTSISPWCISTNSLTSDKPMPDEGCRILLFLLSVSKRLKREPILSGAIPIPSSIMEMRICWSDFCTVIFTVFPGRVYLNALDNRLNTIFSTLSLSIHIYTSSWSALNVKSICFSSAIRRKFSVIFIRKAINSVCSTITFIFLFCIFRKSSIWLTRRNIRSVFLCTTVRCSRTEGEMVWSSRTSLTGLEIRVNGVRSSCEISVKNFSLIFDNCCSIFTWWRSR